MPEVPRVLVVDDDPAGCELTLAALFEVMPGCLADACVDGIDLFRTLQRPGQSLPSLILLDLKMPCMDGIEVLARLRADPSFRSIPVVILTSSDLESDIHRSVELGANAYVLKPVDSGAFLELMRDLSRFWILWNRRARC